ncbi:GGDEF domain-containing protein [Kineococcus sp. SYSU DK004]|uniref:GGDEF domain-containing protein n=1 Tax=Kineococcus sp. SYSU DK004 TaxID=3383125 RepID=UPI003D7CC944
MQDADFRRLVEDSPLATLVVQDGAVVWANAAAGRLLALPDPAGAGGPAADLVHPDDRHLAGALLAGDVQAAEDGAVQEWRLLRGDGDVVTVEVVAAAIGYHGRPALGLSCWDVTRHVVRQRDLAHRATHDDLTGLPNRALLEDRWRLARSRARRGDPPPVVVFCDVDDLKRVNDEHGHVAGDALLAEVAQRLRAASREVDTVARFGGDEFVVLVDGGAGADPRALAARLRESTAAVSVRLPSGTVTVRCSVGLVVDDLERTTAEVLADADGLMYEQKRAARG